MCSPAGRTVFMTQKKKNLSLACSAFFAGYYMLLYVVGVMFSSYLIESGFDKGTVATMSSVSAFVLLFAKPLFSSVVDKGHCRTLAVGYAIAIAAGSCFFFFSAERTMVHVLVYTLLCSVGNGVFMELTDSWVLKIIKQTGEVDYGKARAFGSASFAMAGLVYGAAITAFGYGIAPWCILGVLALLVSLALYMPNPEREQLAAGSKGGWSERLALLRDPLFLVFVLCGAVAHTTLGTLDTFVPVLITEKGGNAFYTGLASFVMAVIEFIMLRRFTAIADKLGTYRVVMFGIMGFGVKALAISLMPTPALIIAACTLQVVSFCLYIPGRMRFLQQEVSQNNLAGALTTLTLACSLLSTFVTSPAAGYLSENIGTAGMMRCFAAACFIAGGVFGIAVKRITAKRTAQ